MRGRNQSILYRIVGCGHEYSTVFSACQVRYLVTHMDILSSLFFFLVLIPSAILHEFMHGFVADRLGDNTARLAGRLTLNPLAHIDLWGTIILPIGLMIASQGRFMFAYAKPVPYNPYNLRDQRFGPMQVALAGPLSNIALAATFGLLAQLIPAGVWTPFLLIIVYTNVLLAVFNLVPIPPLDGSKVLYAFLPSSLDNLKIMLERYGFIFLLIFMIYFFPVLYPVIDWLVRFFTGAKFL